MTVAIFAQPNFNVDDPTTYRTKLDGNTAVATAIIDNFAPHAVGTPNMTVQLDAGAIPGVGAAPVQVALQTSATLTAPTANPRNDIVYIDSATGVIGVATGTEAASPADPAVPAGKIAIARLAMTVGMVSITNSIITDLRAPAMAFGGGSTFTAISTNTTLTIGQSGGRFKLTGVATAVTLPTPSGNANTSFLLWGGDANTQTISPAASSFKMPDGTTPTSYSVTANQGIEVVSDGSVYQVVRMVGKVIGQTPTTGDNSTQSATTAFVQTAVAAAIMPSGAVAAFAMNTAPTGWLACNGASVSTTTYAALFSAIGYTYGGSGASFNLPDLRGYFLRGSGTNSDGTAAGTFGAKQADDFKSHTHALGDGIGSGGTSGGLNYGGGTGYATGAAGGTETRPRNIAMLYCIKT